MRANIILMFVRLLVSDSFFLILVIDHKFSISDILIIVNVFIWSIDPHDDDYNSNYGDRDEKDSSANK